MAFRFIHLAAFLTAAFVLIAPTNRAEAQTINPVVRTFRPDPNWGREEIKHPAGELVMVDQTVADPAAFLRANRCVVGRWVFSRKLEDAYYGHLEYANANDDHVGVRAKSGPYRVRVSDELEQALAIEPAQWADVVILRAVPGSTYHELVAYTAKPKEGEHYLPRAIANTSDSLLGNREYAYRGGGEKE